MASPTMLVALGFGMSLSLCLSPLLAHADTGRINQNPSTDGLATSSTWLEDAGMSEGDGELNYGINQPNQDLSSAGVKEYVSERLKRFCETQMRAKFEFCIGSYATVFSAQVAACNLIPDHLKEKCLADANDFANRAGAKCQNDYNEDIKTCE